MKRVRDLAPLFVAVVLVAWAVALLPAQPGLAVTSPLPWVSPIYRPYDPVYNNCIDRCMDVPGHLLGKCVPDCAEDSSRESWPSPNFIDEVEAPMPLDQVTDGVAGWADTGELWQGRYIMLVNGAGDFCIPALAPCEE
jgi:hypothetical protein